MFKPLIGIKYKLLEIPVFVTAQFTILPRSTASHLLSGFDSSGRIEGVSVCVSPLIQLHYSPTLLDSFTSYTEMLLQTKHKAQAIGSVRGNGPDET